MAVANHPPEISIVVDPEDVANQPTAYSADLTWAATSLGSGRPESCTYVLEYGPRSGYGEVVIFDTPASTQSHPFTNLPAECTRYYRITATDSGGIEAVYEGEFTLDTPLPEDDSDGDGLPDTWESLHYGTSGDLNTLDGNDPAADFDGDGLSDLDEYLTGTRPDIADTDSDGIPDDVDNAPLTGGVGIPLDAPNDSICGATNGATLIVTALLLAIYALLGRKRAVA
jgi:hypothetical protein